MSDQNDNQALVDDDVARALDSLADIDPASPASTMAQPTVPNPVPPPFDPSVGSNPVVTATPVGAVPSDNTTAPISDVTGPSAQPLASALSASGPAEPAMADPVVTAANGDGFNPDGVLAAQPGDAQQSGLTQALADANPSTEPALPSLAGPSSDGDDHDDHVEDDNKEDKQDDPHDSAESNDPVASSDLIQKIRLEAAHELEPLISSLDDSFERYNAAISMAEVEVEDVDKRGKMLEEALDAAKGIEDTKLRAEALAEILSMTHQ